MPNQTPDRRAPNRFESLHRLNDLNTDSIKVILDFALDEAIHLTQSSIGYLFFYDDSKHVCTLYSWSKAAMDECKISDKQLIYHLDETGMWGESIRHRSPFTINCFDKPNALKKGYPDGHVTINKFLSIPIIQSAKIVATVGVANKTTDYAQEDIDQ